MKKLSVCLLSVILIFSFVISVNAQTVSSENYGFEFSLPNNWTRSNSISDLGFFYIGSSGEWVKFSFLQTGTYLLDQVSEEFLLALCGAGEGTNANYFYTQYGNNKYFQYETQFSAYDLSTGNEEKYYKTELLTAKNGNLYDITYCRQATDASHFSDITNMLYGISFDLGNIRITINGQKIYPDSAPVIIENRTLVPIRAIAEKLGYDVQWDGAKRLVTLTDENKTKVITITIGESELYVNDTKVPIDVPARIINDRTYLPVRAVTEAIGAEVDWDGNSKTVIVSYK